MRLLLYSIYVKYLKLNLDGKIYEAYIKLEESKTFSNYIEYKH